MEGKKIRGIAVQDIALTGMMTAVIEVSKAALGFLPNIELTSFWIILFTLFFGRRILFVVPTFILIEGAVYGFGLWWVMYLYAWPLLALAVQKAGIGMVLEHSLLCLRADVRFPLRHSLCGHRCDGGRTYRRPDRRVHLVGGGHSVGHRPRSGEFRTDAGAVQAGAWRDAVRFSHPRHMTFSDEVRKKLPISPLRPRQARVKR